MAPPLFWLGQALAASGGGLRILSRYDFETYFHRALLLAAIVLLWPLLRLLNARSWRDLGLEKNRRAGSEAIAGFFIAAIPLLCFGGTLIVLGIYSLREAFLWSKMPAVLSAALVVPLLEELLFRGFILGVLLRSFSRLNALLLTSALYSIIHFLKPPEAITPNESVTWFSGFVSIGNAFWQFRDPLLLVAGFLVLFVVGCVLADARLMTRSLWLPIGLHAGWVFANGTFSKAAHRELLALPWLGKDLLVGIVPLILAFASWALVRGWFSHADARALQPISRTR